MDLPCHQLFPGATLSTDQYRRRSGRHLPDEREDLLHRRGSPYQVPQYPAKAQVALQLVGFLQTPLVSNRTFQEGLEGARLFLGRTAKPASWHSSARAPPAAMAR